MNVYFLTFHDFANALWNKLFGMLTLTERIHDVHDHQWNLVRVFRARRDETRRAIRQHASSGTGSPHVANWLTDIELAVSLVFIKCRD